MKIKTPNVVKIPLVGWTVWRKAWKNRNKGFTLGAVLGFVFWALSVDLLIAVAMIPVVIMVGLVFLPLIIGMILSMAVFGLIGYGAGMLTEKYKSAKQGTFMAGVAVLVLVGLFIYMYKPAITTGGLPPAEGAVRQTQYAMKPFATLASVSGRGPSPGEIFISYPAGYTAGQPAGPCPAECTYGCLAGKTDCAPVPRDIVALNY